VLEHGRGADTGHRIVAVLHAPQAWLEIDHVGGEREQAPVPTPATEQVMCAQPRQLDAQSGGSSRQRLRASAPPSAHIVGLDGLPTGEQWDELPAGIHAAAALLPLMYERNPLCVSSALLRREAVLAAGGLDLPLPMAADWDLWLRLLSAGHG